MTMTGNDRNSFIFSIHIINNESPQLSQLRAFGIHKNCKVLKIPY